MKIKYFFLKGNCEIIAPVLNIDTWETDGVLQLDKPMQLILAPSVHSPMDSTIILKDWIPWAADSTIALQADMIAVATDVSQDMIDYYEEARKNQDELLNKTDGKVLLTEDAALDPGKEFIDMMQKKLRGILDGHGIKVEGDEMLEDSDDPVAQMEAMMFKKKRTLH